MNHLSDLWEQALNLGIYNSQTMAISEQIRELISWEQQELSYTAATEYMNSQGDLICSKSVLKQVQNTRVEGCCIRGEEQIILKRSRKWSDLFEYKKSQH